MNALLWIANIACAAGFAYSATFSGATLAFGRALSSTNSNTGYQDAVTPPWSANLTVLVYGACIAVIGESWWAFGTFRGCAATFVILAGAIAFRRMIPQEDSIHFKTLIIQSMVSRYADYVRDNDKVRAAAMKDLLDKAGVPVEGEPASQSAA